MVIKVIRVGVPQHFRFPGPVKLFEDPDLGGVQGIEAAKDDLPITGGKLPDARAAGGPAVQESGPSFSFVEQGLGKMAVHSSEAAHKIKVALLLCAQLRLPQAPVLDLLDVAEILINLHRVGKVTVD